MTLILGVLEFLNIHSVLADSVLLYEYYPLKIVYRYGCFGPARFDIVRISFVHESCQFFTNWHDLLFVR